MSIVKELYESTLDLYSFLQKWDGNKDGREQYIEKLEHLLNERQSLLEQMKPPFSDEDKLLGAEIAKYDGKINILLNAKLNEIKMDITSLKQKKQQQTKYENPYMASYEDGMFLDKKK